MCGIELHVDVAERAVVSDQGQITVTSILPRQPPSEASRIPTIESSASNATAHAVGRLARRGELVRGFALGVLIPLVLCLPLAAADGLMGYWEFEGNLQDSSGNGRDATMNIGSAEFVQGLTGLGIRMTEDRVTIPWAHGDWAEFTVEAWFYLQMTAASVAHTATDGCGIWWDEELHGLGSYAHVGVAIGGYVPEMDYFSNISFTCDDGNSDTSNGASLDSPVTQYAWHYIVITSVKGGVTCAYYDGDLVGSWPQAEWGIPGEILYLGGRAYHSPPILLGDGILDEIRIYNRALSAEEVADRSIVHSPTADAGDDQSVWTGSSVQLDGSGSSDPDGDSLAYLWWFVSKPVGSEAVLSDPLAVSPEFNADVDGTYALELLVSDGKGGTDTDSVIVAASYFICKTEHFEFYYRDASLLFSPFVDDELVDWIEFGRLVDADDTVSELGAMTMARNYVPDAIDHLAVAFELAYHWLVDTWEFQRALDSPLEPQWLWGTDDGTLYDVIVYDTAPRWQTFAKAQLGPTWSYTELPTTEAIGATWQERVFLAAHEYFHGICATYRWYDFWDFCWESPLGWCAPPGWIREGTAQWAGYRVCAKNELFPSMLKGDIYPMEKDLRSLTGDPEIYQAEAYWIFLIDNAEEDFCGSAENEKLMRAVWENARDNGNWGTDAISSAISNNPCYGDGTFDDSFQLFAEAIAFHDTWFPGSLSPFYEPQYSEADLGANPSYVSGPLRIENYGVRYFRILLEAEAEGMVHVAFDGDGTTCFVQTYNRDGEQLRPPRSTTQFDNDFLTIDEAQQAVYVVGRLGEAGSAEISLSVELLPRPSFFSVDSGGNVRGDGTFYASEFLTGSADVAEWVTVSEPVEAGDVLELHPNAFATYRLSQYACSTLLAGVVSTKPGFTLGEAGASDRQACLALCGIVPVKVTNEGGPIAVGDLLVTSSTPGHAMRWASQEPCPCALVGKALEPMADEIGIILILLTAH